MDNGVKLVRLEDFAHLLLIADVRFIKSDLFARELFDAFDRLRRAVAKIVDDRHVDPILQKLHRRMRTNIPGAAR